MGTWDVGPFDNDTAADFGGDLDEVAAGEREGIVRSALTRVIDTAAYLEAPESEVAVAALVAAQCPGGEPADPTGASPAGRGRRRGRVWGWPRGPVRG
ncbi:DUF4259 domain-containing protein [Streptomyces chryseus]|uniref:DUF4259 domain-containing protein n=1 Tax=Streptomyces chryseus TaxID=68186 RepID=UPI00110FF3CD|nr:DUF4259 domain-containing protein [Streptomyces chryseus]